MANVAPPNRTGTTAGVAESPVSGLSWAAVIGGAVAGASVSLLMLALGSGLGFTSASAYQNEGASAVTLGVGAAVWMIVTQIISSGLGGYLAGRLRTKWTNVHNDEVYFRDTAHGFLVWAVSAIIGALLLASAASSVVGGAASLLSGIGGGLGHVAAQATGSAGQAASNLADPSTAVTDTLLRGTTPAPNADPQAVTAEVGRIVARSLKNGSIAPDDRSYVAAAISARTGLSQADAEKRIDTTVQQAKDAAAQAEAKARQAADAARAAAAYASLWLVVSMLIGAFCASYGAVIGGRSRDRVA